MDRNALTRREASDGRRRFARTFTALALLCGVTATSCSNDREQQAAPDGPRSFADLFFRSDTVVFEEPSETLIGRLWNLRPSLSGDTFAVLDPMNHQVRLHTQEGLLLSVHGGPQPGDGPGELNIPLAATWDLNGHLWVSEQMNPRLTRFRPDLTVDTVVTLQGEEAGKVTTLYRAGGLLAAQVAPAPRGLELELRDTTGAVVRRFHRPHANAGAPYWSQFGIPKIAASDSLIAVGFSMEYPLKLYSVDGELLQDDFGRPPPSWRQATLPERGEFAIGSGTDPMEWRSSFSRIHGMASIGRDCLLVIHEVPDQEPGMPFRPVFRADLYSISSEAKLLEDVELPGDFLHARGDKLFLLTKIPPSPWTVEVWTPHGCDAPDGAGASITGRGSGAS